MTGLRPFICVSSRAPNGSTLSALLNPQWRLRRPGRLRLLPLLPLGPQWSYVWEPFHSRGRVGFGTQAVLRAPHRIASNLEGSGRLQQKRPRGPRAAPHAPVPRNVPRSPPSRAVAAGGKAPRRRSTGLGRPASVRSLGPLAASQRSLQFAPCLPQACRPTHRPPRIRPDRGADTNQKYAQSFPF